IAPDKQSLSGRWDRLQSERNTTKKDELFHPDRDRSINRKVNVDLGPYHVRTTTVAQDHDTVVAPCRYAFRSLDRQWIIPDHRLLSMARSQLWECLSNRQTFVTAPEDVSPTGGPALTLTALIPDQH